MDRRYLITSRHSVLSSRMGLHWAHAMPDGGPAPRDEPWWRTVSGIMINTPWGVLWAYFRRGV